MRLAPRSRALLIAAAALAAGAAHARAQSIPIMVGGSLTSTLGTPVDAPIVVDMTARPERLGAFTARLTWDPAVLSFDAPIPGDFGGVAVATDSVAQGILRMAGANAGGYTGLIILGSARFTPIGSGTSALTLTVSELAAATSFADLLPNAVVTSGSYCTASGVYGDMNQDAAVTSADALIAVTHAVGLPTGTAVISLGDVDADGITGTRDALGILSYVVGLPTPGFRILQQAGGACTTNPPLTIAIVPGTPGVLLPNQALDLQARVTDPSGVPQSAAGMVWRTTDAAVVTVDTVGHLLAMAPGSATVWAIRDALDSAQLALTVVASRTRHVVDAQALQAVNQLGTPTLPFGDLTKASLIVAAGDTVDIQPGRYDGATFNKAVVLLGHSAGQNGPVIGGAGGLYGLYLTGLGVFEVHDLAIEGFQTGLWANSVDTLSVDSLRILARYGSATCFTAGVKVFEAWRVEVRRSQLVGDGTNGCAAGIRVDGNVRTMVVDRTTVTDFGYAGIYTGGGGGGVDSMDVRRTVVNDNDGYGLYVYNYGSVSGRIPPTTSQALVVDSSRFERNTYEPVYAYNLRSARVAHSLVDTRAAGEDALQLEGSYGNPAYATLIGDSILVDDYDWFYGYYFDSVTVDSMRVVGAYEGDMDGVDYVRLTNSSFTDSRGAALYVYPNVLAFSTVVVDSVTVLGGASCGRCAGLVDASDAKVTANRVRLDDFYYGIDAGDSSITLTNAVFTNGVYGVYGYGAAAAPQRMDVSNATFTDVDYAVYSNHYVTVLDGLSTLRGYYAVETSGVGADTVRNLAVTDIYDYGIDVEGASAYVANNTIVGAGTDPGIYGYLYNGAPGDSIIAVGNTISCGPAGRTDGYGIQITYADARLQGNTITGCGFGIEAYTSTPAVRGIEIRGNVVNQSPTAQYPGIETERLTATRIVGNTVTGGGPNAGGISTLGNSNQYAGRALVDSNTVQQTQTWGIRAEYVDSLEVRDNLIEDVGAGQYYSTTRGAISLSYNFRFLARVAGNTVRRPHGVGVYVYQTDTATVFVDSNAVSAADTAAVLLEGGTLWMRHNNIRNNLRDGVYFATSTNGNAIHDNAFQGNALYAVNNYGDANVDALGNWWGVDNQTPGSPGTDSVNSVIDDTPLASAPTNLPPLAPPALRPLSGAMAIAGMSAMRAAGGAEAPAYAPQTTSAERLAQREGRVRALAERMASAGPAQAASAPELARRAAAERRVARALERLQTQARLEAEQAAARAARDSIRTNRLAAMRRVEP